MGMKWFLLVCLAVPSLQQQIDFSFENSSGEDICLATCDVGDAPISEGDRVPDPTDCYQYYICSDGDNDGNFDVSDYPLLCPDGTYFDTTELECISIPTDGSSYCTNLCNPCKIECTVPGTVLPDPHSCSTYFICLSNLTPLLTSCPTGTEYDFEQEACLPEGSAKCYDACDECSIYCTEEGRVPDPDDCHSYYYCEPPNELAHFHCASYEMFDRVSNLCVNGTDCTDACPIATAGTGATEVTIIQTSDFPISSSAPMESSSSASMEI